MMIPKQDVMTSADLWKYPFDLAELHEKQGRYFCTLPNGLELSCAFLQEGDVTKRRDTFCNTADHPILCEDIAMRFPFV